MVEERLPREVDPLKSPMLLAREDAYSLCSWDGTYHICRSYPKMFTYCSLHMINKQYGPYGTFRAFGYVTFPADFYGQVYPFFLERIHGWGAEGLIGFVYQNGQYRSISGALGGVTFTNLVGQDWTTEKEFKVVWTSGQVEFYVAGGLVATHTTDVPANSQSWGIESVQWWRSGSGSEPLGECATYQRDFEQIS